MAGRSASVRASEEWTLSRQTCRGLFLIPLTWTSESGNQHELMAVFDTGGSPALIDPDALEKASGKRIPLGTRVRMTGVSAGPARFTRFRPQVRELDHLGRALGHRLDVFLPFRTFGDFLLILDYPKGELRISRERLADPDGVEIFSSRGSDKRPWLQVSIGGVPVDERGCQRPESRQQRWTVRRGNETIEITVQISALIP